MIARIAFASLTLAAALLLAPAASGQTVRATGVTSIQFVTLRSLVQDSVPVGETNGDGLLRHTRDGTIVRCVTGLAFCRYTRAGDVLSTLPVIQDITLSAWGFGRGVRAYAQLRGRAGLGEEELWPRADDRFDALVAYIEWDHPFLRLRGGRQWKVSGLGYYNWDGASVLLRPTAGLTVDLYGGWSLARGLNEPHTGESLAAVEAFAPDARALLLGLQATWRPSSLYGVSALYQREIRDDRLGLYAERVALDGRVRRGRVSAELSLEADAATRTVNDARLRTAVALRPGLGVDAFARHYRPYFELWTIWGAFEPIGFGEAGAGVRWQPAGSDIAFDGDVAWRAYPDMETSATFGTVRSNGWRFGAVATWRPDTAWVAQVAYHADVGFGAGRNDASAHVRRDLGNGVRLGARALWFDRAFELRVSQGEVLGLGLEAETRLGPRSRVLGSLAAYRHTSAASGADWSQVRGSLRLEWTVGPEPGMPSVAERRR